MLKAVSLFTGVGGLDFGFEAAGFTTAIANDNDPVACHMLRLNRGWPVIEGNIDDVSSASIMEAGSLNTGEADLLIGGPPCQPFSKSSYWVNGDSLRLDDPRADTLTSYLRILRDVQPKTFLLENVHGLAFKGKDEGLRKIIQGIEQINKTTGTNYSVSWQMLNAANYGVPQMRERIFMIGSRDGKRFLFPTPTHCKPQESELLLETQEPYRVVWDAVGDLPDDPKEASLTIGGKWADLVPTIPEGKNYLWHTNRNNGQPLFGWRTRYWSFLLKLAKNQPSWTIQAQPGSAIGPFHWRNRKLSVQEMCRIQTFPDGLIFNCGRTDAQRLIGNAVPSLIGEVLGREIRHQLLGEEKTLDPLKLLPPVRRPIPGPEPIIELPEKYHHLIKDHADHPGEGKGRISQRRRNASLGFHNNL